MTSPKVHVVGAGLLGLGLAVGYRWWSHRKDGPALGYLDGVPRIIEVVTIDGKPVEVNTARAFERMRKAAAAVGVRIKVVSGFRTMDEQRHLFECYQLGTCNNGNYAEPPGYSKHQSGQALDLNTREAGVAGWLKAHGELYGFHATVANEPWHWEYTG